MAAVYIESGKKTVFACAYDWPGWCRSAKDEDGALETLAGYVERYRVVVNAAGLTLPKTATRFEVVDRIAGDGATDFGVPHGIAPRDRGSLTPKAAARLASVVEAAWQVFDDVAARTPASLKKGPRGGGRDTEQIVRHVTEAERAYSRKLGIRQIKEPDEVRAAILEVIRAHPADTGWPVRYAARRIAWHVIDHLWEIEDKS